jgi:hypothetical protein
MQYKLVTAAALAIVAIGCDPSNNDVSGPVILERIMVQDAHPFGVRGVAMDLLDTAGSPLSTAVRCDATTPCSTGFLLGGVEPDFSCTSAGVCSDPLAAGLAPLTPPETHRTGEEGGTQLRLVFNKVLSSNSAATDVLEVDDAAGAKVAGDAYYDPSGLPTSSDPVRSPYGPALVFKPTAPFQAGVQYTIKINAALVKDRDGNPMADQNGTVVSGTFSKAFTTEGLKFLPQTTLTDVTNTAAAVSISSDEILQLGFNAPAGANTTCTATSGGTAVAVKVYAEAGASAASCASADATLLNIVAVDALGAPIDWPAGGYDLSCDVAAAGGGGTTTITGSFTVAGTPIPSDPQSRTQHVACASP